MMWTRLLTARNVRVIPFPLTAARSAMAVGRLTGTADSNAKAVIENPAASRGAAGNSHDNSYWIIYYYYAVRIS
jgi:hypothetical protein